MPGVLVVAASVLVDSGGLECDLGIIKLYFSLDDISLCVYMLLVGSPVAINYFLLYTRIVSLASPLPVLSRVSRALRVIITWSILEPKIRICPRLLFPVILRLPSPT